MPSGSALKISRILHAGYIFEYKNTVIAFDTIFENPFSINCYAYPDIKFNYEIIKLLKFDAVFISHYHDDHCSLVSLNYLNRQTPIYIFCVHLELFDWIKSMGFSSVYSIELNHTISIKDLKITPLPSLDIDVDSIFHIQADDINILNVVDSWIDDLMIDSLAIQNSWDLILWPFQTMQEIEVLSPFQSDLSKKSLPIEWKNQLLKLKPKYLVPSSCQFIHEEWSWYNHIFFPISYEQFQKEINQLLPNTEIIRMNPSSTIELNQNKVHRCDPLPWIIPIGNQNIDYYYKPDIHIPPTSEICKNWPDLNKDQLQIVNKFCQLEIPKIYAQLPLTDDPFFHDLKLWQLSVYDHTGKRNNFYFKINLTDLRFVSSFDLNENNIYWLTEISEYKLFRAIKYGESLSSLYLRVNDTFHHSNFNYEILKLIPEIDIIEDPLIRCLYYGRFGEYQKSQLTSLRSNH